MNQKQFNINWSRVLFIVLLFCIIFVIIYSTITYRYIVQSRTDGFAEAKSFVLDNSKIETVNDLSYFQAEEGFFTFSGKDKEDNRYYVFLQDNETFSKETLYTVQSSKQISAEQVEQTLIQSCSQCDLIKTQLAIINEIPLWELTYIDESNRYVMEYKYLENGKTFEKISLTRKN